MFNTTNPDGAILAGLTHADPDGTVWRKSQRSGPEGNCVEVAKLPNGNIGFRNTKKREAGFTEYTPAEVSDFLEGVKDGEFNYLV